MINGGFMDLAEIKNTMLEVIDEYEGIGPGYFQQTPVLNEVANRLNIRGNLEMEQAILTVFDDLFRSGHIGWGHNLSNAEPPFLHLNKKARETLENYSKDPANPEGYIKHLNGLKINAVADSYIKEAIETYNNNCFKASAVMVGGASECIILELRDNLVNKMNSSGVAVPAKLKDWKVKTIVDAIDNVMKPEKKNMPQKLSEMFSAYWPAFSGNIRMLRNDAGHPKSVDPVTQDNVHASLLIFPELVKLIDELDTWISNNYPSVP